MMLTWIFKQHYVPYVPYVLSKISVFTLKSSNIKWQKITKIVTNEYSMIRTSYHWNLQF